MSGPKLSQAEIEMLKRQELERARQEAIRKLKAARAGFLAACDKSDDLRTYFVSCLRDIDQALLAQIKAEIEGRIKALQVDRAFSSGTPEEYDAEANRILREVADAEKALKAKVESFRAGSRAAGQLRQTNHAQQSFQIDASSVGKQVDVSNIDFRSDFDSKTMEDKLGRFLAYFQYTADNEKNLMRRDFAKACLVVLQKWKQTPPSPASYGQVNERLQQMINEEAEILRASAEWDEKYSDYIVLTEILNVTPIPPEGFRTTEELVNETRRLLRVYRKKDDMDYIADMVNEVMVEFGYGLVSSRVLMGQGDVEQDYSLYQADENTGITVYTDENGGVMMQMTVLGQDETITDCDRDFSLERQMDFCAQHPELVEALREKGVILGQVSYQAPDKKHTVKVKVDSGSSEQKTAGTGTVTKKKQVDRRRRRAENKVRAMRNV